MKPNQLFLNALCSWNRQSVVTAFEKGEVDFAETIVIEHRDGSVLRFNNATVINDGDQYLILTEHLGYFVFHSDTDYELTVL